MGFFLDEYTRADIERKQRLTEIGDIKNKITFLKENATIIFENAQSLEDLLHEQMLAGINLNEISTAEDAKKALLEASKFANLHEKIVNDATEGYLFGNRVRDYNKFVRENVFVANSNLLPEFPECHRNTLRYLHLFSELKTDHQGALAYVTKQIIDKLSKKELCKLLNDKGLSPDAVVSIPYEGNSQQFLNKLLFIYSNLQIVAPDVEHKDVRLKGVTFTNEDGSSRQDYLKELEEAVKTEPQPIEVVRWVYNNEPAAKILWQGKEIGALPATDIKDITDKYGECALSVDINGITGGYKDGMSYGCDVALHVFKNVPAEKVAKKIVLTDFVKVKEFVKEEDKAPVASEEKEISEQKDDNNGYEELNF